VPEAVVGRAADGTTWVTTVLDAVATDAEHDEVAARLLARADAGADVTSLAGFASTEPFGPSTFEVRPARSPEDWCDAVAAARDELRAGTADKVVLAREVTVAADEPIEVASLLRRLRSAFPASLRFSVEGFVGASPELLVARHGEVVACHPMAGTAPRRGDPGADARLAEALRSSTKNAVEHRHTIDLVHDALLPYCSYLDEEAEPSVVALANVQHLATRLEGRLSSPPASVVELVCVLHPTPAVCGRPRAAALELIERYEDLDRSRYAGPVGWVDHRGNGSWAVGIRSAEVAGPVARVFAGVGVVADSDPRVELAETRAKLQALLTPLLRP
jgi:menaquinone-specific isochorismate synthase